jgi:hypothetical protein
MWIDKRQARLISDPPGTPRIVNPDKANQNLDK